MYSLNSEEEKRVFESEAFAIRVHRAKSWVNCSCEHRDDPDVSFISLWVALNCCYSVDGDADDRVLSERESFRRFISRLIALDEDRDFVEMLWGEHRRYVEELVANRYVFQPFWNSLSRGDAGWTGAFEYSKHRAIGALEKNKRFIAESDVETVLIEALDRLYCLRNQLVHGGATYGGSVNREQIFRGRALLAGMLPVIIDIMQGNESEREWGSIPYPVVVE